MPVNFTEPKTTSCSREFQDILNPEQGYPKPSLSSSFALFTSVKIVLVTLKVLRNLILNQKDYENCYPIKKIDVLNQKASSHQKWFRV